LKAGDIPFVKNIGIEQEKNELSLECKESVYNHMKTIHAGAQFTLAETQSGIFLLKLFPELEGEVTPLLRDAHIKYRRPAVQKITAYAAADEDAVQKFRSQLDKKGRASLKISVKIKDINDLLTSEAVFTWFIQKL
jgi:acyl-coenzyme A thioesterase PaaI-like protein